MEKQLFHKESLHKFWSNGQKIKIGRKLYSVGKMSYGDYFLEPGKVRSEKDGFNEGTLWLEKRDNYFYTIAI